MNEDYTFRLKLMKALLILMPQFSPLHGSLHEQEKVSFSLSNKQEPPFRQLVIRHTCDKKIKVLHEHFLLLFSQGHPATTSKHCKILVFYFSRSFCVFF